MGSARGGREEEEEKVLDEGRGREGGGEGKVERRMMLKNRNGKGRRERMGR